MKIKDMKTDKRSDVIDILEAYSIFLEKNGYMDTDWRTEEPFAIDEFLRLPKTKILQMVKPRWRICLREPDEICAANACDCYLKWLNDAAYEIWREAADKFYTYNQ